MRKDEKGHIVVETITSFILFVFMVLSILSLINITTVQARMHYALTQAAETVSMYSYVLDLLGASEKLQASANRGQNFENTAGDLATNINVVVDAIQSFKLSEANAAGKNLSNRVQTIADDPTAMLQDFMNWAVGEGTSALFETTVLRPLITRYLSNGEMSGAEFLEMFHVIDGVDGLEFHTMNSPISFDSTSNRFVVNKNDNSAIINGNGDVRVIVQYRIDYTFGALPLPDAFAQGLRITQEVTTKSWGSGVGEGYTGSKSG